MASSSSSSSAGDSPSLVASWLSSIDLSHAVPNFEMAGIVSPRSLAELELVHYGPLGVTSAEHRKRLFYLVQRVRSELGDDKGGDADGGGGEGGGGRIDRSTPRNDGRTVEIRHDDDGAGSGTVEVVRLATDRGGPPVSPATLSSPLSERDHYGGRGAISRVEDGAADPPGGGDGPDGLPHGTDGTCRRDTLDVLGSHRRALSIDVGQDRPHHELPERSPARERLRTELRLRRMRRERRAAEDGGGQRRGPDGAASPAPGNAREESLEEGPTEAAVGSVSAGERGHDELDSILRSPGEVPRARIDPAAAVGGGRRAGGSGGAGDPAAAAYELDSILRSPGDVPRREGGAGRVPLDGAAASAGRGGESKLDSEEEEEEKKDDDDYDGSAARSSAGDAAHRRTTVRRTNYASAAPSATASVGDRPGEDERPRAAARRKAGRRRSGIPGGLAAGGSRGLLAPRSMDDDDDASLSSVTSDLSASVAR